MPEAVLAHAETASFLNLYSLLGKKNPLHRNGFFYKKQFDYPKNGYR